MQDLLTHSSPLWIKKIGVAFSYFFITFFTPLKFYLLAVGMMVFADLVTGIRAAKKRGESIESGPLRRTVEKLVYYFLAIILSEVMMRAFFNDILPDKVSITYVTASFIGLVELKSNFENISVITGLDIWKRLTEMIPTLGIKSGKSKQ